MWPGPTQRTPTGQYPADVPVAERLPAQHTFDFLHSPFSGSPSCWCVSPPSGWSAPPSQRSCSSPGSSATCRSTASSPTSSRWKPPITTARRTPESDALPVFHSDCWAVKTTGSPSDWGVLCLGSKILLEFYFHAFWLLIQRRSEERQSGGPFRNKPSNPTS